MKIDNVDIIQAQWKSELPEIDTLAMGVVGRISRVSNHIDHLLQENYSKFNLNGGEFDVLATLRRSGPPYQLIPTELYNALMITSGTITNRLDQLEKKEFVSRSPNPNDRRGTIVTLTKKGIELMDKAYPLHIENELQMINSLSESEKNTITILLRKMLLSFENEATL